MINIKVKAPSSGIIAMSTQSFSIQKLLYVDIMFESSNENERNVNI